jgi:hypothetical protein
VPIECRGELLPAQVFLSSNRAIAADETVWDFDTLGPRPTQF